jgi:hypothetical protein
MAQDTFDAAEAASRQAREERMASVGALPMTGLQLPGAPVVLEPSEQLEADCQDQVQALAVEIVNRGAAARATVQGVQRPEGEMEAGAGRGTRQPGTMPPPPVPARTGVSTSTAARARTHRRDRRSNAWASDGPQLPAPSGGPQARATSSPISSAPEDSGGASNPGRTIAHQRAGGARAWTSDGHQTRASDGH